ncbi:MAG TPA: undecaprenyl-phosphate glucose phosphotransferase [Burkholderiales bacterium]|nr:undecaprenyl-phosphate glucose phosphotransferase [Burkholderiales bacterium]
MLATDHSQRQILNQRLTPAALVQAALEPLVAEAALFVIALAFGESFGGPYLILALILFSLTFPGDASRASTSRALAIDVFTGWLVVIGLLLLIGWATQTLGSFSSPVLVTWALATPALLFIARMLIPVVLPRLMAAEGVQRAAVIAGEGELGRMLAGRIRSAPFLGIRVAGFFDDRSPDRLGNGEAREVLGPLSDLAGYVKTHRVDLIYLTLPMASQPRILNLLEELRDTTASIYFTPDIFLFDLIQARMDQIGGVPVLAVCETPFYGVSGLIKRVSDIVLALAALVLILPVMLVIAAGIKLTSRGPVLFTQRRYGLDGREIIVYKFRTMTVLEDGDVVRQATRDDRRVTPFGALLRKYSLDELPQFINVLQGRMSVVGPRPHAVAHNEMYRKLIRGYMIRHKVKPGITGWAQVNGLRGETETLEKMRARIEYDLSYLRNWSLQLDLQIVLKTVLVVLRTQDVY